MRFCFHFAALALLAPAVPAAVTPTEALAARVTSVVRADLKTGRLVRTVVVSARVVAPAELKPVELAERSKAPWKPEASISTDVGGIVQKAAEKYDLDPLLVHSVIEVESNYNPYAVSPKGALGMMQLIPSTARRFGVTHPFDPRDNIEGGVRYLKYLSMLFPADLRLVLAAYNAGESAVARRNDIPRYPETEQYVYRVGKAYGKRRAAVRQTRPAVGTPAVAAEPVSRPVESYIDAEGRLNLRTR